MEEIKLFLGGTCNNSTWRDELIPELDRLKIPYFNPVVKDWTPECQAEEQRQKDEECAIHLYVITSEMEGVFSIAQAVDSAWQSDKHCIFFVLQDYPIFNPSQLKSLEAVGNLIIRRGGSATTIYNKELLKRCVINEYKKLIKTK